MKTEKKFTPIAMKCTQEQWDSIKDRIPKKHIDLDSFGDFQNDEYLVNNLFGIENKICNISFVCKKENNRTVYETFNAKIFLDACGIDCEPKYSITKLQLTQLLKNNEEGNEQLVSSDLRAWFPEVFKKELVVGKWYKDVRNDSKALFYLEEIIPNKTIGMKAYGFSMLGEWTKSCNRSNDVFEKFTEEATSQEVEAALISEAKRRYEGNMVKPLNEGMMNGYDGKFGCLDFTNISLDCNGELWCKFRDWNAIIYCNGQWATIIQPEKMTLEQIEKELGRKIQIV